MNTTISGFLLSIGLFFGGIFLPSTPGEPNLRGWHDGPPPAALVEKRTPRTTTTVPAVAFRHGDISWLPSLAAQAGWPEETWAKLGEIILRESGGCPNRRGGDVVNENCEIIRVSEWNHRSDTGLLQINGVNYNPKRNKWARICSDMGICEQEPLLDALTNLKAGYVLYTYSGWDPWDPCTYGEEWAHLCDRTKKKKP
ncbi:MAG: hypothetical protein EBX09_06340 [Actinobacteria bacterium]|jgi:hypothetical protein|nr:hypothetical protein [Actinomycetota bacterium]